MTKEKKLKNSFVNLSKNQNIMNKSLIKQIIKHDYSTFTNYKSLVIAKITKNFRNFCFAKSINSNTEFFIPIQLSKYCIFGDIVLLKIRNVKINSHRVNSKLQEAFVLKILTTKNVKCLATVKLYNNSYYAIANDKFEGFLKILETPIQIFDGDRILIEINRQNFNFKSPVCNIIKNYGNSSKAHVCCEALLNNSEIPIKFSKKLLNESVHLLNKNECEKINRLDLTKELVLTIDSQHAKDLDDAISVKICNNHYVVGVHIADVSNFVKLKTNLDKEALSRGNSIYIADRVIPMLPPVLSENLCSLQPNKIRLTFSVIMLISLNGDILSFDLKKTKIKSKLKGTYEEINNILLNNFKNKHVKKSLVLKYSKFLPMIKNLYMLVKKLINKKNERGCLQLVSSDCRIILNNEKVATSIFKRNQNVAEKIIEELMILANKCVANFMTTNKIPLFYRVHEPPNLDKMNKFKNLLNYLNIFYDKSNNDQSTFFFTKLINKTQATPLYNLINSQILRTMSKAKYSSTLSEHYGLALKQYTHFTSPIRRYCDLMVHRLLTEYLYNKKNFNKFIKKIKKKLEKMAVHLNDVEQKTLKIERTCELYFKSEFMLNKINKKFQGTICACTKNGMFVELNNTIEGFIKIETLKGKFKFDGFYKLINVQNKKQFYSVGQLIEIKCVSVNVPNKTIDFEICE